MPPSPASNISDSATMPRHSAQAKMENRMKSLVSAGSTRRRKARMICAGLNAFSFAATGSEPISLSSPVVTLIAAPP